VWTKLILLLATVLLTACGNAAAPPDRPTALPPAAVAPATSLPEAAPSLPPPQVERVAAPTPTAPPPTAVPSATPTAAPQPPQRLTEGGCCAGAFWSPDGQMILYVDRPSADAAAGLWGVPRRGGAPILITEKLGSFSADLSLRAYPTKQGTVVERLADGQTWTIPNGGRAVAFAPDGGWVAWSAGSAGPPFDSGWREIWTSRVDGSEAARLLNLWAGGLVGWFPDGSLLVSGYQTQDETQPALWRFNPSDASLQELARTSRARGIAISPGGRYVAYANLFADDPAQDGLWVVDVTTGTAQPLDLYGSYRWRAEGKLVVIPLEGDFSDATRSLRLVEFDLVAGSQRPLNDPARFPLRIASGEWEIAPDGQMLVYRAAQDYNLWLLALPE
jgi:Tol biopolymer transport system component